ncbi:tetratricopeptide repeat protein [Paraburkholderia nemoris]|uniref:Tetratricopeptide repeat protein n=1 Tax=Paraburkholderia nemoris TaxID=2793076 RepID=A0ABN7N5W4_9BURK|nr:MULTISPECIES: tetratricopeptide repeat protein [Paraburkholderia]KPD14787.1 tetratricopeptide repeat family protein [Burkholderia sp. ST111]MBK5146712.1 tetratricopeptide repeat protein [Burkholderia sp. R-69608]MBK3744765.1 tetratricopeptide repeat protein [Paraburkholderia aspalathi]MBK3784715.1 tetratricopeptide repeat protein [Paraburkholderia aspalathi]MBK3816130.1 tetratricopeptide repeat protein [Paraburkholderia aspalathi]
MLTIHQRFKRAVIAAAIGGLSALVVLPVTSHAADSLRPDVAKPLNAAQDLYRAHKYKDALTKIDQADAVPGKTPYESYMIQEMRGAAAAAAGESGVAAQAYETLLGSGRLTGADEQRTTAALAGIYFQQKNYAQSAKVAQRYLKSGGSDPDMRTLLVQSYYLSNDCASVVSLLKPGIDAQVRAGHAPDESQLQLLGTCAQRVKDDATYRSTLEKLVAYHPKQSYWDDLFNAIRSKPGYSSALDIDTFRLRRATGSLSTADDYMEMTQLAIVAGTTAEGKQVIDQGFASGVLGHDAQADREKRLQALAAKRAQAPADPANPVAPVDVAFNEVFAGQAKQGLTAMDAAIAKGGIDHPDQAQLHLGEAYYMAGDKARAVQTFRAVKGTDGSADLARLWVLVASK